MKQQHEYIELIRTHQEELKSRYGVSAIVLFGSVARNEHKDGSDVDLFVDMPPKFMQASAAADYLEDLLGNPVDLIRNNKNLSPFFLSQIKRDGITIYPES